jgi:YVTN family beta-propeller protein
LGTAERLVDEQGGGLVYVTSLTDNVVSVVDPQRLEVIARIAVGHSPHEVVFLPNEAGELRGYVTNFTDHSVSVIDLQEGSPTRFQELKKIGGEPQ